MLRYTLAVSLLLATANAGTAGNLRLRGGGPVTFSKLTKGPDALSEGYGTTSKVEISHSSDLNGETSLKSTFVRSAGDKISALFNAKTSYQGVALEANLDGSGTIVGSASYDDVIPGAKLTVSGVLEGGKAIKDMAAPKISTEYKKDNLVASVSVEGSSLSAGGVVEFGDIQVGASGSYNADDGSMGDPSFAARYKGGNFGITAVLKGLKGDDISATYTQSVSGDLDVAGTFTTNGNKFALGANFKLDADQSIRGKVNSDGILNIGYAKKLTKGASLNAGLELDTNNLDSRKIGVSLNCS